MTIDNPTPPQARAMRDAIELENQKDAQQRQDQHNVDIGIATAWFNTQGININAATTRTQALDNFNQINSLLQSETDAFRLAILRKKLKEANEKYKAVKKVNPNS